jgi:hypothetical protein
MPSDDVAYAVFIPDDVNGNKVFIPAVKITGEDPEDYITSSGFIEADLDARTGEWSFSYMEYCSITNGKTIHLNPVDSLKNLMKMMAIAVKFDGDANSDMYTGGMVCYPPALDGWAAWIRSWDHVEDQLITYLDYVRRNQ